MRLRQLREERNLYQKDVAKMLGVDRTTYVKYENESSEPPIDTLIRLAEYYSVTLEYLVDAPSLIQLPSPTGLTAEAIAVARLFMSLTAENKSFVHKQIDLLLAQQATEKESNAV